MAEQGLSIDLPVARSHRSSASVRECIQLDFAPPLLATWTRVRSTLFLSRCWDSSPFLTMA